MISTEFVSRNSYMKTGEVYFWTATIHKWEQLLFEDQFKRVITSSLDYLSSKNLIDVFGFVIMPNHIHLIWRVNKKNGKESAQGSFLKYTAHEFKKLLINRPGFLNRFKVIAVNKAYEFWQRDPLAINLFNENIAFQKLEYIHNNPLAGKWNLANSPENYFYSSASFYEKGEKHFAFLKDIREVYGL